VAIGILEQQEQGLFGSELTIGPEQLAVGQLEHALVVGEVLERRHDHAHSRRIHHVCAYELVHGRGSGIDVFVVIRWWRATQGERDLDRSFDGQAQCSRARQVASDRAGGRALALGCLWAFGVVWLDDPCDQDSLLGELLAALQAFSRSEEFRASWR
jgi:hypothetical protein